jgi:SulP family sulfate permease
VTSEDVQDGRAHVLQDKQIPDYVAIFRIHGPFLFGATDKLDPIIERIPSLPPIVVLRLRNMTAIDGTGLASLEQLADALHASGRELLLCGAREQPRTLMARAEFHRHIGDANVCANVQDALERARVIYEGRAGAAAAGSGRPAVS